MLGGVFISYRREDSAGFAGRIDDRLSRRLDAKSVFLDVDNIQPGLDFVEVLAEKLRVCDALIAVIGKNWNSSADKDNRRRLDDPDDFVRIEIEAALRRGIRVIPVLVDGAAMPRREDLPDSLQKLRRRQAIEISHNRFDSDVERLTRALSLIEEELRQRELAEATQGEEVRHQQEAAEAERQEQKEAKGRRCSHRQEEWRLAEAGAARPVRAQEPAAIGSSAMAQISHGAEPDRPPQAWNTPSRTDAQTSAQTRGWLAKVGNSLKTLQGAVVTFVALCTALLGLVTGGCNFPLFIHSCQIVGLIGGKPEAPETVRPRSAEDTAAGAGFFHSPRGGHEDQANWRRRRNQPPMFPGRPRPRRRPPLRRLSRPMPRATPQRLRSTLRRQIRPRTNLQSEASPAAQRKSAKPTSCSTRRPVRPMFALSQEDGTVSIALTMKRRLTKLPWEAGTE